MHTETKDKRTFSFPPFYGPGCVRVRGVGHEHEGAQRGEEIAGEESESEGDTLLLLQERMNLSSTGTALCCTMFSQLRWDTRVAASVGARWE